MGGGAMWSPVMAAANGASYTRSTSPAATNYFQPHSVISKAPCIPSSSTKSIDVAEACSDHDNLQNQPSFKARERIAVRKSYFDLGPVPTRMEAEKALADLQRFMPSETISEMKNIQSTVSSGESRMLQSAASGCGREGLRDALNMLRKDPSMQNMIVSISSDKGVWDAILSNCAVQDLRGSLSAATEEKIQNKSKELNIVDLILKYLTGIIKSKVVELIEKFGEMVAKMFKPADKENPTAQLNDLLEKKIRSSLLLSVVVLLIIIVTRNS